MNKIESAVEYLNQGIEKLAMVLYDEYYSINYSSKKTWKWQLKCWHKRIFPSP